MVAVAGLAVTAALTEVGFLAPVRTFLQTPSIMSRPDGQGPTLSMPLGLPNPWLIIIPVVLLAGYWLLRSPHNCMQALESLPRWAEGQGHTVVNRQDLGDGVWQIVIRK